jgi:hypothetical protein
MPPLEQAVVRVFPAGQNFAAMVAKFIKSPMQRAPFQPLHLEHQSEVSFHVRMTNFFG